MEVCSVPGFQLIQIYLAKSVDVVELYYMLFALLFDAQKIKELPERTRLDLNSICKYVFDKSFDSQQTLFSSMNTDVGLDVSIILLAMIRTLMNPIKKRSLSDANSQNNNKNNLDLSKDLEMSCEIVEPMRPVFYSNDANDSTLNGSGASCTR